MFLLVASVEFSVVGLLVTDHPVDNFEQPLSEAPQSAGVGHALLALRLIISLAPNARLAKAISPKMNGVSKEGVARPANFDFPELAGLENHGRSSGKALESVGVAVAPEIGSDGGHQPRRQHLLGSW